MEHNQLLCVPSGTVRRSGRYLGRHLATLAMAFGLLGCGAAAEDGAGTIEEQQLAGARAVAVSPLQGEMCEARAGRCYQLVQSRSPTVLNEAETVVSNDPVASVSARNSHTCAAERDGTVHCWGSGDGVGSQSQSATTPTLTNVNAISAGRSHSCAVHANGEVSCWGNNSEGALGVDPMLLPSSAEPVLITGLHDVVAVSAGSNYSCALSADHSVRCWGTNRRGELGPGADEALLSWTPVLIPGVAATRIDAGAGAICSVTNTLGVTCWGNRLGSLGESGPEATQIEGLELVIDVAVGRAHACAMLASGEVKCWGNSERGQLGVRLADSAEPVLILDLPPAASIGAGGDYTCVLLRDGAKPMCWGGIIPEPEQLPQGS